MVITVKIRSNLPWLPLDLNARKLKPGEEIVYRQPGINNDITWVLKNINNEEAHASQTTIHLQADGLLASEPTIHSEIIIGPQINTYGPDGRPWNWKPEGSIFRRR